MHYNNFEELLPESVDYFKDLYLNYNSIKFKIAYEIFKSQFYKIRNNELTSYMEAIYTTKLSEINYGDNDDDLTNAKINDFLKYTKRCLEFLKGYKKSPIFKILNLLSQHTLQCNNEIIFKEFLDDFEKNIKFYNIPEIIAIADNISGKYDYQVACYIYQSKKLLKTLDQNKNKDILKVEIIPKLNKIFKFQNIYNILKYSK